MHYDKLSAGMMMLVQDAMNGGLSALMERRQLFGIRESGSSGEARVTVFLHTTDDDPLDDLQRLGVVLNSTTGKVRTADIPLRAIEELTKDGRIQRISSTRYLRPLMDVAGGLIGIPSLRTTQGLDGKDVVIGIVDSGIDGSHAAFSGRIERVWDQTKRGRGVAEGRYGRELVGAAASATTDENGHGTHVAGIAAGDHSTYGGVAPAARLVIVKTDLLNGHIADGIRYIFRVAGELGLPAVVNLSLGGHSDAHDGSDGLSQIVDQESGQGRIVVCAAGNEGEDDIHASLTVAAGGESTISFRIPQVTDAAGNNIIPVPKLNGWYEGAATLEIAIQAPNGEATSFQAVIGNGPPSRSYDFANAIVTLVTPGPNPDNGDHQFLVDIANPNSDGGPEPAGTWRLRLKAGPGAPATVHVWALDNVGGTSVTFRGDAVVDGFKIGSPGSASTAITVASYTCRTKWTDAAGNSQEVGLTPDSISSFSSEGPRRDGVEKPDIAAPGAMICSAASAQGSYDEPLKVGGGYRMEAGTSMASPFVAGVVALLLQKDPNHTPDSIKTLLKSAAAVPGASHAGFNPQWGWGVFLAPSLENALQNA